MIPVQSPWPSGSPGPTPQTVGSRPGRPPPSGSHMTADAGSVAAFAGPSQDVNPALCDRSAGERVKVTPLGSRLCSRTRKVPGNMLRTAHDPSRRIVYRGLLCLRMTTLALLGALVLAATACAAETGPGTGGTPTAEVPERTMSSNPVPAPEAAAPAPVTTERTMSSNPVAAPEPAAPAPPETVLVTAPETTLPETVLSDKTPEKAPETVLAAPAPETAPTPAPETVAAPAPTAPETPAVAETP